MTFTQVKTFYLKGENIENHFSNWFTCLKEVYFWILKTNKNHISKLKGSCILAFDSQLMYKISFSIVPDYDVISIEGEILYVYTCVSIFQIVRWRLKIYPQVLFSSDFMCIDLKTQEMPLD